MSDNPRRSGDPAPPEQDTTQHVPRDDDEAGGLVVEIEEEDGSITVHTFGVDGDMLLLRNTKTVPRH